MKKTKVVMALACAVLLVTASVMGTLAYLKAEGSVTNTFTFGNGVSMTLDEAKVDDTGKAIDKVNQRGDSNTYALFPNHEYDKDPTVHVTGDDCYVFITVKNDIASVIDDSTKIETQITNNDWKQVKVLNDGSILYVYAENTDSKTAVRGSTTTPKDLIVFDGIKVKSGATNEQLTTVKDKTIVIKAYAVQIDGFESETPANIYTTVFETAE